MLQLDDLARLAEDYRFRVQFYHSRHLRLILQHLHRFYIFRQKRKSQSLYRV